MIFMYDAPITVYDVRAYKFTGKERDPETDNDNFGARYYSSTMGRWITPDWSASAVAVPYANFSNPQSLNLYAYVGNNPVTDIDADGHFRLDMNDAADFVGGVMRGVTASFSLGTLPGSGPQPTDSTASRIGQAIGSAGEGVLGAELFGAGAGAAGLGVAAEIPSGGISTVAVVAGAVGMAVGSEMIGGAITNLEKLVRAPDESRRQGDFAPSRREERIKQNAEANAGTNKCENCGWKLVRTQNTAGETPPKNQLHVHHDPPIKDGGGKNSSRVVLCRECHEDIHN